jgi:FKBP-type peptidyl-prolyl cis-trans isomerase FkpA
LRSRPGYNDQMRLAIPILVLALAAAACGGSSNNPASASTVSVPFSSTDLRTGTGTQATTGKRLTVNYTGWLYSTTASGNKGAQFDTSVGKSAFTFTLGAGQVIKGWDQGIAGMRVGGQRRLVIPPDLAYGSQAIGSIPANSTLVFEVDLLDVQ